MPYKTDDIPEEIRGEVENDLSLGQRARVLLSKLMDDPDKTKAFAFKRRLKEVAPELKLPDIEAIDSVLPAVQAEIGAIGNKLDKFITDFQAGNKTAKEAQEQADFEAEVGRVKSRYQLTDDGMAKVFERMKAMNSPDVEGAAAAYTDNLPRTKPVGGSGMTPARLNFVGSGKIDEDWAKLHDPSTRDDWFDEQVMAVLAEAEAA